MSHKSNELSFITNRCRQFLIFRRRLYAYWFVLRRLTRTKSTEFVHTPDEKVNTFSFFEKLLEFLFLYDQRAQRLEGEQLLNYPHQVDEIHAAGVSPRKGDITATSTIARVGRNVKIKNTKEE